MRRATRLLPALAGLAVMATALAGCRSEDAAGPATGSSRAPSSAPASGSHSPSTGGATASPSATRTSKGTLPGMPPVLDPTNIYAADRAGALAPAVRHDRALVYVPDGIANRVDVIDQASRRIIYSIPVGRLPQHVVPSWDLRTLWVTDDASNDLIPIDPRTGKAGSPVPVADPYNLYFTPDGKHAMVMAERLQRIDFRQPHTMALQKKVFVGCKGVDHGDFTVGGRYFLASCEFAGKMVIIDVQSMRVAGYIDLGDRRDAPQDVKLSPDGRTFYVADMHANGIWRIDARTWRLVGLTPTGRGAHGLYVSRDAKTLYISNRDEGSISLLDLHTGRLRAKWRIPASPATGFAASPDMGNVDASGRVLWLSGRYSSEVYAIDTRTGALLARIPTGSGPHGLCVWPQPGRYSLGHTGILR